MHLDLHGNKGPSKAAVPYLLNLQADVLSDLPTRLVAPVREKSQYTYPLIEKLHIPFLLGDREYILFISEMAVVGTAFLGEVEGSLIEHRTEILAAVDLMVTGF